MRKNLPERQGAHRKLTFEALKGELIENRKQQTEA
jgi:hypothetical protein